MIIGNIDTLENGLHLSLDWLSFTVKKTMVWQAVAEYFGLNVVQFQDGLNGSYGYRKRARHMIFSISVLYDGNEDMGIHVDISGSAIGYFLQCYLSKNTCSKTPFDTVAYEVNSFDDTILCDVLKDILDLGQVTRLDLAIDDVGCRYYTVPELDSIFHDGLYTSRFKKFKSIYEGGKDFCSGSSIYLGSRKSELMIRIYDKQLEQKTKKHDVSLSPWVRWEIELHKNRATVVATFLASGKPLPEIAIGILSNYLRLIVRDKTRDSRCSTAPKWHDFLSGIDKLKICQPVSEKTIDEKREWIMKQVAPTISAIYEIDGDLSFIYSLIENGSLRLSPELEHIICTSQCAKM